jgi:ABC-type multidrug transport system ATPase subunit
MTTSGYISIQHPTSVRKPVGISLDAAGKKFNREWIFRNLSFQFEPGKSYAITGPNGTGKSTLLQCIAGAIHLSEGSLSYHSVSKEATTQLAEEDFFKQIAISAPYLELIEEMTAVEFLSFHQHFKPFLSGISISQILQAVSLDKAINKQIRYFSSGMKQRLKLAQAFYTDVPVILLDEPCANLDTDGYEMYKNLCTGPGENRLTLVGSNDAQETVFCSAHIHLPDYQ